MSTNLQRLALMAGITLTESAQAAEKKFQIKDTAGKVVKICYSKHEADQFISKNQDKRYHVRDVSSAKVTEAESNEVGWHVYDKNDKCVLGPTSEAKANAKAKELGGDEKGYTVGYTSDYAARRANESTGSNKVFDDYADWKNAAEKHGLEIFASGAASGKYEARKYNGTKAEVCGRFDKNEKDGWIHSSALKEDVDYDDEGNPIPEGPLPQGLIEIAQKLGFRTLDTQNSDSLDFKEVSAAGVKSALLAAYNLGKTQGTQQATPAASQPTSGTLPAPTSTTPADHQQIGR